MKMNYWMGSIPASPTIAPSLAVRLFDTVLGWIERGRQRRALGQLDDRLLSDIGVDHATAKTEAGKPPWRN
jgi:uncharacterized protein YjiS (DUF1127 family)